MNPLLTFIVFAAPNPAAVAEHALQDAAALTSKVEAGGSIYQCGSGYAYTAPVAGKKDHVDIEIAQFEDGVCRLVATYHTHPKGDAKFSLRDVANACAQKVPAYILPIGGKVREFDCARDHRVLARGVELR